MGIKSFDNFPCLCLCQDVPLYSFFTEVPKNALPVLIIHYTVRTTHRQLIDRQLVGFSSLPVSENFIPCGIIAWENTKMRVLG